MLHVVLAALLALSPAQDHRDKSSDTKGGTAPDTARVEAAVARLDAAFKTGDSPERIAAMEAGAEVPDAEVVKRIVQGLRDKDAAVSRSAIDSLGWMQHPDALHALVKHYRQSKTALKDDAVLLPLLLKAIGRHGSPEGIEALTDDPFSLRSYPAIQARVYGLGNIRTKESLEALMDMSQKVGMHKLDRYMDEIRLAAYRISGVDQGNDPAMWAAWWTDAKKTFEVPKDAPELVGEPRRRWERYWRKGPAEEEKVEEGKDGDSGKKRGG